MSDNNLTKINIQKHYSFKIADAIVSLIVGSEELDVPCPGGPDSFYARYGVDIVLDAWDNCREQGYCFTLHMPQRASLTVQFGTHRNCSEQARVWVGGDKHDEDGFESYSFGSVNKAAEFILDTIAKYLTEGNE